jgi:methionyl aminopeptidase
MKKSQEITLHSSEDFEGMRKAGKLAAKILTEIEDYIKPGVTTNYLNNLCHEMILDHKAIPAPLNYRGFPKSVCTSINHVVCHGIPNDKNLNNGDILNLDVTVILDGWHGDTSKMFLIGDKVSIKAKRLVEVTEKALYLGIEEVKPGAKLSNIGQAIQTFVEKHGYSLVRDYCGHGIGKVFHAPPNVVHYYDPGCDIIMEEGMFFTIEPMVNAGKSGTKLLADDWTVVTKDASLSAQFEHTIGVTNTGYEIFTQR